MDADSSLVTAVLPQPNHSGGSSKCYIVVHDIECPPGNNWAVDLGGPSYLQNPSTQASVQYIVDAENIVQGVAESDWAWGCGTPGSQHGIHIEQAGYASFTRAQWLGSADAVGSTYRKPNGDTREYSAQDAADMGAQFQLLARLIADICERHGWRAVAASAEDLRQEVQGVNLGRHVRHLDVSAWVGGTNHSDPGEDYPWADLLTQATHYLDGTTEPTTPPDPPEEDVPLSDEDVARIAEAVWTREYKQPNSSIGRQSMDSWVGGTRLYIQEVPARVAAIVGAMFDKDLSKIKDWIAQGGNAVKTFLNNKAN